MRKFQLWLLEYLFCNLQKSRCIISLWEINYKKSHINLSLMILFPPQLRKGLNCDLFSYLLPLQLPCLPLLIQILARCDATDHTRYYWSTLVTLGRHGILLAPSGVSAFLFYALAPQQGKGHTWKDSGVFERLRNQFTPWLSYTKASLSLPSIPKKT